MTRIFRVVLTLVFIVAGRPAQAADESALAAWPASEGLSVRIEYNGTYFTTSVTIVAKVTKGGYPVSGQEVWFEIGAGPHYGKWSAKAVTGSDGIARVTIPGDGLLGVDTAYAYVPEAGSQGGPRPPDLRPHMPWGTTFDIEWSFAVFLYDSGYPELAYCFLLYLSIFGEVPSAEPSTVTSPDIIDSLYRIRDDILAQSPEGYRYVEMYYQHSPEIIRIAIQSPALLERSRWLLQKHRDAVCELAASGRLNLSSRDLAEILATVEAFSEAAGPELKTALQQGRQEAGDPEVLQCLGVRVFEEVQ